MLISEIVEMSRQELDYVEKVADAMWRNLGVDIEFTRHFFDRVNDPRNKTPITVEELIALFKKEYQKHGREIADFNSNGQAVMKDILSKINIPFVVVDKGRDRELVMKTVMRKNNFMSSNPEFKV
jgi:hypothetical protein